jgi:thiosulfate/3-mercaptopyruvate sulfurtransferase
MSIALDSFTRPLLLTPETLLPWLASPHLVLLDASYYLPTENQCAKSVFSAAHLPKAHLFDLDNIADTTATLPHMLPLTPQAFEAHLHELGVTPESWLVVYDQKGLFSAPRVWWMLAAFGWQRVSVLQGGLPAWQKANLPIETGTTPPVKPSNQPLGLVYHAEKVKTLDAMMQNLSAPQFSVIDARAAGRFYGTTPEPRVGLKSGHIPHSHNLPFTNLLTTEGFLKPVAELQQLLASIGVTEDATMPVACTCGSGITACVVALALEAVGYTGTVSVYDGSWMEWGSHTTTPIGSLPFLVSKSV